MERIAWLALTALLLCGTPGFAESDVDGDGILDNLDNCSIKANPAQDDTDGDYCGNLCDADYTQDGRVGVPDYGIWLRCFVENLRCPDQQHVEPISEASIVNVADFGYFSVAFGGIPGPSGTTPGTVACPTW